MREISAYLDNLDFTSPDHLAASMNAVNLDELIRLRDRANVAFAREDWMQVWDFAHRYAGQCLADAAEAYLEAWEESGGTMPPAGISAMRIAFDEAMGEVEAQIAAAVERVRAMPPRHVRMSAWARRSNQRGRADLHPQGS